MRFDVQYSTMSPVLPFDILDLIIDIFGENKDINLLRELALVCHSFLQICHSFLQICSKQLFATVELNDVPMNNRSSNLKKRFVKLLEKRPDVVKYIRKLKYKVSSDLIRQFMHPYSSSDDDLLSPILPNFLRTIPRLNCLKIDASGLRLEFIELFLKISVSSPHASSGP